MCFEWVPKFHAPYRGLLEPRESKLALLKSTFNAENFICRLTPVISAQFTLDNLNCVSQAEITKKIH